MTAWGGGAIRTFQNKVGTDQLIVLYIVEDVGMPLDPAALYGYVAEDANGRAAEGWRIVSTDTMPMRQMGTAGNILFQSGGQYATQAAIAVVYTRG
jgi:hypothetical protein